MPGHCTSCGKEYTQHAGIIGTCAELQRVKAECDRLQKALNRLTQGPTTTMPTEIAEAYEEVARAAEDMLKYGPPPNDKSLI